jgi:hypothetical protein
MQKNHIEGNNKKSGWERKKTRGCEAAVFPASASVCQDIRCLSGGRAGWGRGCWGQPGRGSGPSSWPSPPSLSSPFYPARWRGDDSVKGTVSQDFLLQVFYESSSPKPLKITLGSLQILSKIRGDIRKSRCATGINYTSGKFSSGVNYTGGK